MEPVTTITISVFITTALYGIGKFIKKLIKNSTFKSSCMINHQAEQPEAEPE